jgi:hypothetical protein
VQKAHKDGKLPPLSLKNGLFLMTKRKRPPARTMATAPYEFYSMHRIGKTTPRQYMGIRHRKFAVRCYHYSIREIVQKPEKKRF